MSAATGNPKRLHPATVIVRWLKLLPQLIFAGVAAGAASRGGGFERLMLVALVVLAASGLLAFLYWWRFRYTILPGEIVIEKGLIHRQRRVIPFDRVQDIAIEQKPLARLLGIAKVRIETGGAGHDEGDLDSIALADAHSLRDHIRRGVRADAEAPPQPAEEPLLFAMDLPRLLVAGLFSFSLVFLAVISAALQQLDQFGLVEWNDLFTAERADEAAHLFTLRVALSLIALVLVLGLAAGVVRTVLTDFGFRLTRSEAGLRRRRGLLTLSEVVIPIRRAQVAWIESGLVSRAFGWHRLSFQTLGADRKEGGVQVAAPFARMAEILPILAEAGFPPPPPRAAFRGSPRRALVRRILPWLALGALLILAAFVVDRGAGIGAAAAFALALWAMLRWRTYGHAEDLRALYVTGGLLNRRLRILPYEKAQTLSLAAGPVQRPLRLATLLVDTAGASQLHKVVMVDLDADEAGEAMRRLYRAFLRSRGALRTGPSHG